MDRFEIESWLRKYRVESYTINEDMSVDVDGDVHLSSMIFNLILFQPLNNIFPSL